MVTTIFGGTRLKPRSDMVTTIFGGTRLKPRSDMVTTIFGEIRLKISLYFNEFIIKTSKL